MTKDELENFIGRYHSGVATGEEHKQFSEWLTMQPAEEVKKLLEQYAIAPQDKPYLINGYDELVQKIELAIDGFEEKKKKEKSKIISISRMFKIAAACIILLAGIIIWFAVTNKHTEFVQKPGLVKNDIAPGKEGAILTLADGTKIFLDSAGNGSLTQQGISTIVKKGNSVAYVAGDNTSKEVAYNTMFTPNGRTFSVVLADGTKVWLNAASSIKFPVAFIGNERRVEITGEAYFEVVKNAAKPFHVSANGTDVQVLGTHFNVNVYTNEDDQRTTLLEGKVKIMSNGKTVLLDPGQQARINAQHEISLFDNVDVGEVMAWKDGYFSFSDNANLQTVMRQLERWYDVEVAFEGASPSMHFGGKISRNNNISEVLKILELSKVHFRVEKKKITVIP